jgi:hypothetical protein
MTSQQPRTGGGFELLIVLAMTHAFIAWLFFLAGYFFTLGVKYAGGL